MKNTDFEQLLYAHAACLKDSMAAPFSNETEDFIMKKAAEGKKIINYKKIIAIIAVAATFLLGSTAFANGVLNGWFSYSEKEYASVPTEQEFVEDVGYAPVLIQEFENGYSYETGYVIDNEHADSKTAVVEKFKSAMFEYAKDGNTVYFSQDKFDSAVNVGTVVDSFAGVDLYWKSYMNKIVPEDYQMTEADQEAEEKGELVFTWGSDSVQTMEVKSLQWMRDGVQYMLLQMGGELDAEDMVAMAKEAIAN